MTTTLRASKRPGPLAADQCFVKRREVDLRRQILNMLQRSDQPLTITDFISILVINRDEAYRTIRQLILDDLVVPLTKKRKGPGKDKTKFEGPIPARTSHKVQKILSITSKGRKYCELMNSMELMLDWEKGLKNVH